MKFGSLFSGGGLVDIAANHLKLDLKFGCEFDYKIASVYKQNFQHKLNICDVELLNPNELCSIDILWMSPVCKNFSNAQTEKGDKESDYNWIDNFNNILDVCNPNAIIIENVVRYIKSYSFSLICDVLVNRGYLLQINEFDFSDFNVPQSRKRMICFATKKSLLKLNVKYPKCYWYDNCVDLIKDFQYYPISDKYKQKLKPMSIFDYKNSGFPKSNPNRPIKNSLFFTILSSSHKAPYLLVTPNLDTYKFSDRALARIMTVPDDYILPKSYELSITVLGNGVPVEAAKICIEHVINSL